MEGKIQGLVTGPLYSSLTSRSSCYALNKQLFGVSYMLGSEIGAVFFKHLMMTELLIITNRLGSSHWQYILEEYYCGLLPGGRCEKLEERSRGPEVSAYSGARRGSRVPIARLCFLCVRAHWDTSSQSF